MKGRLLLDVLCQIAAVLLILLFLFDVLGCRTVGYSYSFFQSIVQTAFVLLRSSATQVQLMSIFWTLSLSLKSCPVIKPTCIFQCFAGTHNVSICGRMKHGLSAAFYGIYPEWAAFMKTILVPQTEKHKVFAKQQEWARKDVERAFVVLLSVFNHQALRDIAWGDLL